MSSPDSLPKLIQDIKTHADGKPFGVNVFVPPTTIKPLTPIEQQAIDEVHKYYQEHAAANGLKYTPPPPHKPLPTAEELQDYLAQYVDVMLEHNVPVVSFHFGVPPAPVIAKVQQQGAVTTGCATNVEEAVALQEAGIDFIVAQVLSDLFNNYDSHNSPPLQNEVTPVVWFLCILVDLSQFGQVYV